jgi:hypothetical protein
MVSTTPFTSLDATTRTSFVPSNPSSKTEMDYKIVDDMKKY